MEGLELEAASIGAWVERFLKSLGKCRVVG